MLRLPGQVIKFALIFLGSVGTILLLRWVVVPMLPVMRQHESLLDKSFQIGFGLFGFALMVVAAVSFAALVSSLWDIGKS
jgi:hypothetical protein